MPALAQLQRVSALSRPSWRAVSATLQSRANSIRNNAGDGAVAGAPGTDPTNWAVSVAGLTKTISGVGARTIGLDTIDYRWNGTTNTTEFVIGFEGSTGVIAAAQGEIWALSAFLGLVSGGYTNVTAVQLQIVERDSGSAALGTQQTTIANPSSVLTRFTATFTVSNASCAFLQPRLRFQVNNASAVDIGMRVGRAMLHRGSSALSPIRTSTSARTGVHVSAGA